MQDPNWDCKVCQERRLQQTRNCPLLPPETPKDPTFKFFIKDEIYTECPKGLIDNALISAAFEAHEFYTSGFLPEQGTVYDQTQFFVRAAVMLKQKYRQLEAEAYATPD